MKQKCRKIIFMISSMLIAGTLFLTQSYGDDLTAGNIVEKMDNRYDGDSMISEMTMVLIDKNNKKRVRQLKGFSKDFGKDEKSILFFMSPADVRNTSLLVYDWKSKNKNNDTWLYLPALRKVKRINSSDRSRSFMGSDFSYMDINGLDYDEWSYKFIRKSVKVNGNEAWEIEAEPKKSIKDKVIRESGYNKIKLWIRKDIFMVVKAKFWVPRGNKIKFFKAKDIKKINGIYTACQWNMVTTRMGKRTHATVIKLRNIKYNQKIMNSIFTTQRMSRGI